MAILASTCIYLCVYTCNRIHSLTSLSLSHTHAFSLFHSPWGEHEIDYVLFYTVPSKDVLTIQGHPDEVDDLKWVTKEQLLSMLDDKSLLFSPWCRLILNRWFLTKGTNGWWDNLKDVMTTDKFCDYENVHAFDPPKEHLGGAGKAGPLFLEGDSR